MRIGIDIDDVITNTSETMEEYIMKHENSKKIKEHMVEIMKGNPSEPEIVQFCTENYIKVFKETTVKQDASEVIKRLLNKQNEIYLITARGENLDFFKGSEEITIRFLEENDISYNKIIFNSTDKASLCKDNNIDLMIDDSVAHCEAIRNVGIKTILFTSSVNKNIDTTVERVDNWLELETRLDSYC